MKSQSWRFDNTRKVFHLTDSILDDLSKLDLYGTIIAYVLLWTRNNLNESHGSSKQPWQF